MRSAEQSAVIDLKERFDGVWTADTERKFTEKVRAFRDAFRRREGKRLAAVEKAEGEFRRSGTDEDRWNRDFRAFAEAFPNADLGFWSEKWEKCRDEKEREAVHGALLHHWRVEVQRRLDAELERDLKVKIAAWKKELEKRLGKLKRVKELMRVIGGAGEGSGLDPSNLNEGDLDALERLLGQIASNKGLAELCRQIGRQVGRASERKEKPVEEERGGWLKMRTDAMREELSGVRVGRSIEDALPSELAACGDEDVGTLFDLKFIEGQMLCFEKTGEDMRRITERKKVMRKVDEEMGPVIICVDTSGSMQGRPEVAAKAVTLTLALQTRRENRKCHIIEFSTGIKKMDVGWGTDIGELMKFLSGSFNGGTDAERALLAGIGAMEREGFRKADLLMVSDMEFGDQPERMKVRMDVQRVKGNRFYALATVGGGFFGGLLGTLVAENDDQLEIYDDSWVFDCHARSVRHLGRGEGLTTAWSRNNQAIVRNRESMQSGV